MRHYLPVAWWIKRASLAEREAALDDPGATRRRLERMVRGCVRGWFVLCVGLMLGALLVAPHWAWLSIPLIVCVQILGLACLGHLPVRQVYADASAHLFNDNDMSVLPAWPWWTRNFAWQLDLAHLLLAQDARAELHAKRLEQHTPTPEPAAPSTPRRL